jgi:shikimate dehydrogenase
VAGSLGRRVRAYPLDGAARAFEEASAVINATSAGLLEELFDLPLERTPQGAVVMDMTYKPLETAFLKRARELGRPTVDGLEMLIRQAAPSFEAFFGRVPPASVDVRALCLEALKDPPC